MLKNEEDVIKLIQCDEKMMEIIKVASTLNLPDWWICAGFYYAWQFIFQLIFVIVLNQTGVI